VSDTWYRDPYEMPPFEDGFGKLWTLDGRCLNPDPDPGPTWLDEWPEDLQFVAFDASVLMELADEYERQLRDQGERG
jgi:hypothetical protein